MVTFFIDLVIIIGLLVYLFNWVTYGFFPSWAMGVAVLAFCGALIMRIFGRFRVLGDPFSSLVRKAFTVGMPILAAYVLATKVSGGNQTYGAIEILMLLIPLYIVLLGVYIMVWGAFTSPRGIVWNMPIIISIVIFVFSLTVYGYLPLDIAAISMVALILILGIGNLLSNREKQTIRKTFSVSMVLASFAVLLWLSGVGSHIIIPVIAIIVIYIILVRLFSSSPNR